MQTAEVIVVELGAMGSAACWQRREASQAKGSRDSDRRRRLSHDERLSEKQALVRICG
jgi:hypothetical protein